MAESLRHFLERVLATDLLPAELVKIAEQGATIAELNSARPLPTELEELLAWRNGLDLDAVRIHGVGSANRRVERPNPETIVFASDPAGFTYRMRADGAVVSVDHDGGGQKVVAYGIDDFLRGYVFGPRAAIFAGDDWAREVAKAMGSR